MKTVPIWISNRHIHLSQSDANKLFGEGYELKKFKDLSQPWQYACEEIVTIKWPKWQLDGVRILGPYRKDTQVEVMLWDCFKLWVQAPIRLSGDLDGTPGIEITGTNWSVVIEKWVIVAQRHIHMSLDEASNYGLVDGQIVSVKVSWERGLTFNEVVVRANANWALDMHIDIEEGNAAGVKNWTQAEIVS